MKIELQPLSPLALAFALALASPTPPAIAAPTVAHWTLTELGTLGGSTGVGYGINAAGQVAGFAQISGGQVVHAFRYSNGAMTDLGTLGGTSSFGRSINTAGQVAGTAYNLGSVAQRAFLYENGTMTDLGTLGGTNSFGFGVNAAGHVTGYAQTANNSAQCAFLYVNGAMTDLGTLGGTNSFGLSINDSGQVTGYSQIAGNSAQRAMVYSNGAMTDLGTLGGTNSFGYSINASGQVAGYAQIAGNRAQHAFLYNNGTMTDLGTLGGTNSVGLGVNEAGLVTGYADIAGSAAQHAFLYANGSMFNLNSVNGVAGGSLTLTEARGINDLGQITGTGTKASGGSTAYLLTLDRTIWEGGGVGSFANSAGWSFGIAPNRNTVSVIDPTINTTITGPSVHIDVKRLTIGGDGAGNNGLATLSLNGGTLNVLGKEGLFTTITAKGVLTGDGTLNGAVTNQGTVNAVNLSLPGGLTNTGTVTGHGRLDTTLINTATGTVQMGSGQKLVLNGTTAHSNSGLMELSGGAQLQVVGGFVNAAIGQVSVDGSSARFDGAVINAAGGRFQLNDATLRFNAGLANDGQLQQTFGESSVFGAITTNSGGKIILSGNSGTTFYDAIDVKSGGELRVSSEATAVFFGQVFQRTGATFSGAGTKFYEGGLNIGGSPGLAVDSGDVNFGHGNVFNVEIGGTKPCTLACGADEPLRNLSFDKYSVAGHLILGGTLQLVSWNGFVARAGQRFDLLDWGSVSGSFDSIDASGLGLTEGLRLDTTRLALDGSISVAEVPEPGSAVLMLLGLTGVAASMRRRQRD